MPGFWSLFLGLIYFLILFGAILFLAYVSTKFLGTKVSGKMRGKHFRIVDSVILGFDKQIFLVKVGEQLFLTACSNKVINSITLLDKDAIKLTEEEIKVLEQQPENQDSFKNYLDMFRKISKKDSVDNIDITSDNESNKFKQNLNKLKGILSRINSQENGDEKLNE
ncbi:MAG: flagellar biosynthetic protein FliO [Deltaproteobacteria bacterium]